MPIKYDAQNQIFHLQSKASSYIIQVIGQGYLAHRYWGKRVEVYHGSNSLVILDRAFSPNPDPNDRDFSLDTIPLEYPVYGNSDFRVPAFQARFEDGSTVTDFRYCSHRIITGKPPLNGMPSTYVDCEDEAQTVEITLEDKLSGLTAVLVYTVFRDFDVIARSARICNNSSENVHILRALSANVDFPDDEFDFLTLDGGHCNERNITRSKIAPGTQLIDSCRGASSHQHNPFFALLRHDAGEENGEVYAFNLVYSGNFLGHVQVDQMHCNRAAIGINPFDFEWLLNPGESFVTPEAILVYSGSGLTGMSQTFHGLYRSHLCRSVYKQAERPILVNNWEATYFDFNTEKIVQLAVEAKKLGIEMLVLDDGWFGNRNDDRCSLGDWTVDKNKLPDGLEGLANRITALGLKFGLWFEPEMISVDSNLYREHSDWCLHVPNRHRTEGRNQLILDLSRSEVCDYIVKAVSDVLSSADISYVKWDMNRHMTEVGSAALPPQRQRETAHRYILGLYRILEELISKFPNVLFEGCSGGGGRFDPGMLYYMPQIWTSDNTDAVSRMKIQYGTSLVYPVSSISAHVSAVPNHQLGRVTPLSLRGHVAMSGVFGYELDLTKLSNKEKLEIMQQVAEYKVFRRLIQYGDFYRILSPFEENEAAWSFVSPDKSQALMFYFNILSQPLAPIRILHFKGLNPDFNYRLNSTKSVYAGDELMNAGMTIPPMQGDFSSLMWQLDKV